MLEDLPCPGCGADLEIEPATLTDRVRCARCGEVFFVRLKDRTLALSEPPVEEEALQPAWDVLAPGTEVAGLVVERPIATGGSATVYAARHPATGVPFAIKVLRQTYATSASALQRFKQELRLLEAIQHPGVVRVHEIGELEDGRPFLVLDWLEGVCLRDRLDEQSPILAGEAFSIFVQLCDALSAVHDAQVVHRDLKPENVFVAMPGGRMQIKLLDFGAAKVLGGGGRRAVVNTRPGALVGSPLYMAPEQLSRQPVDARADLFALGIMIHEVFTGQWPWQHDRFWGLEERAKGPPPASERLTRRCELLADLITDCLQPRPEDRPPSCRVVEKRLQGAWKAWPARSTVVGDRGIMTVLRLRTRR